MALPLTGCVLMIYIISSIITKITAVIAKNSIISSSILFY
nr:MAG TPA: hypothetical protein [Caudoviricetes sp.]